MIAVLTCSWATQHDTWLPIKLSPKGSLFSFLYGQVAGEIGCDVPHLPPSIWRHMFVDEGTSDERVEGPKNQGAAMAMGNTVASWGADLPSPGQQWSRNLIHFGKVCFDRCIESQLDPLWEGLF